MNFASPTGYGGFISAAEAREKGRVNWVVDVADLDPEAERLVVAVVAAKPKVLLGKLRFYR